MERRYDIYRCDRDLGKYSTARRRDFLRRTAVKNHMSPQRYVQLMEWVDRITSPWRTAR